MQDIVLGFTGSKKKKKDRGHYIPKLQEVKSLLRQDIGANITGRKHILTAK